MDREYTCLWRKIWVNSVLAEPGRKFSRFEAWLYITNLLVAEIDDPDSSLKRGEFVASVRQLAECFHWSRGAVLRFLEMLLQNLMIMRVGHQAGPEAGHFTVCNYDTYNSPRDAWRDTRRDAEGAVGQETEHLNDCEQENYRVSRDTGRATGQFGVSNIYNNYINKSNKDTPASAKASADACVSPKILPELYMQHNRALPEVKALTAERLRRCRSRINQAVRDGCLEQYLVDFAAAVKKAQQTPFLRGEGARGWRASFDWFIANQSNIELVDALYHRKHGLTVTANYSLQDLAERERMHPAIVRRLDDMCRVIQI